MRDLAWQYYRHKNYKDAERIFRRLVVVNSNLGEVFVDFDCDSLANVLTREQKYGEAEEYYKRALAALERNHRLDSKIHQSQDETNRAFLSPQQSEEFKKMNTS